MLDSILAHSTSPIYFTLHGIRHELLVVVREPYDRGSEDAVRLLDTESDLYAELVVATIGTWARVWRAITRDIVLPEDKPSAIAQLGLEQNQALPYVTVQNKSYESTTVTVHSHDTGAYALATARATIDAVTRLNAAVSGIAVFKTPMPGQTTANNSDSKTELPVDTKLPANQAPPQKQNYGGVFTQDKSEPDTPYDLSGWQALQDIGDEGLILPMKKESELRRAIWADKRLEYSKEKKFELQYEDEQRVAYRVHRIESTYLGEAKYRAIKVWTDGLGVHTFFMYQRDSEEQTYNFQSIENYLNRVGIDPTEDFRLEQPCVFVVKIYHKYGEGPEREYKNAYGFWRLPEVEGE